MVSPVTCQAPRRQEDIIVRVHSPETASQRTMSITTTYTTYSVETTATLDTFSRQHACVKRRFSDFEALYSVLRTLYAGYFIPKLPCKDLLQGKLMPAKDFVSKRAQALEVFIGRCADHSVLQRSRALELFLTLDTDDLPHHPEWKGVEAADPLFLSFQNLSNEPVEAESATHDASSSTLARLSGNVMSTFKRLSHQVKLQVGQEATALTPDESSFQAQARQLSERTAAYSALLSRFSASAAALDALGAGLRGLGDALDKLDEYEARAAPTLCSRDARPGASHTDFQKAARAAQSVGAAAEAHVGAVDGAVAPLRHAEAALLAGGGALADRQRLYAALTELKRAAQDKREKLHLVSPQPGSNMSQAQQHSIACMARNVAQLDVRIQALDKDYDGVARLNRLELKDALAEARDTVPLAVRNVAGVHVGLEEAAAQHWTDLARRLGAML